MLSPEQMEKLRLTMQTGGWREIVMLACANRANLMIKTLVLSPSERRGEFSGDSDEVIRGRIKEQEWFLTIWDANLKADNINRVADELDRQAAEANGTLVP